jgi:hypothetical protein
VSLKDLEVFYLYVKSKGIANQHRVFVLQIGVGIGLVSNVFYPIFSGGNPEVSIPEQ